ncbi:glycosyltransferase [bacterium]|nr:glycosyltransferase [bacterium]
MACPFPCPRDAKAGPKGLLACLHGSAVVRLARLVRQERIQVVHTHNAAPHFYGALGGRLAGARVLHTEHGKNLGDERRSWRLNRWVAPLTDLTAAVSEKVAEEALTREGVPRHRLRLVPNGIPVERFQAPVDRSALRRELGLTPSHLLVGTVGRLVPEKNYPLLIAAFARLAASGAAVHLVLVGDGRARADLERAVAARGLARRVSFLGTRSDIPALLGSFDAFVLSSDTEGMPMALLEAMAAGCPIVVTAVGGNAQLIGHDQQGLLVPPRDEPALATALARLLDEPATAGRLGQAARARVTEQYSVQQMTRAYEELWRQLASRRRL